MTNFGELKTKLLTKLTESYTSNNKGEIKGCSVCEKDKSYYDIFSNKKNA